MNEALPETPELKRRERKRFGAGCFVGAIGMLLVLYLLSPPIVLQCVSFDGGVGAKILLTIYAPIRFGTDNLEFLRSFYVWYFSLFPNPIFLTMVFLNGP